MADKVIEIPEIKLRKMLVAIEGQTPLLTNRFGERAMAMIESKQGTTGWSTIRSIYSRVVGMAPQQRACANALGITSHLAFWRNMMASCASARVRSST